MQTRAIIFDMDDTLIRSTAWRAAEERLYRHLERTYDPAVAARYRGLNVNGVARVLHEHLQPALPAEACARLLRGYLLEAFAGPLQPMPGADALLRRLHGRVPLAVASGSPPDGIALALASQGWLPFFTTVFSSEGVARGKPDPDVFLATADALGVPPATAVVIEDSLVGVEAALRAGMTCFVVPSLPDPEIAAAAHRAFDTLDAITLEDLP
jgi:HAD superfamily hydrolase (TIGR01509 family)